MKPYVVLLGLIALAEGAAVASTPNWSVGPFGPPSILNSGRDVCFSQPPDLNGIIVTSEIIGAFGFETRIANAFAIPANATICLARWWGGYYNNDNGCSDNEVTTFNLCFFDDNGCLPAAEPFATFTVTPTISYVGCQAHEFPLYRYEATIALPLSGNTLYWFVAQATDHAFPPQWGRLGSADLGPCDHGALWAPFYGYPEWVPACDDFTGICVNFSGQF